MISRRVLSLSPALPHRNPDNAGARLVQHLREIFGESGAEQLFLVPAGHATDRASASGTAPRHLILDGTRYRGGALRQRVRRWVFPVAHPAGWAVQLMVRSDLRSAVREADVVDVQWQELASLLPLVRVLNPRARTVITLHDVLSQRFAREKDAAETWRARARWTWAFRQARAVERFVLARADAVLVLSDKDRDLVPGDRVHVLLPPLAADVPDIPRAPGQDRLLFVAAMYREENRDGLRWFLGQVWPQILAARPDAVLEVAGARAGEDMERLADAARGVRLLGFVDDLEPLYAAASVVVAPLRRGAGVKFKVVDALVRGAPVVTTSVGAEGIGDRSWFAGVHDEPSQFAAAVTEVLSRPDRAERQADAARTAAREAYGPAAFRAAVQQIYGFDAEEIR